MIGAVGWNGEPQPGDRHLLSASSVSDALASGGLERWKRRRSAAWALDNAATLHGLTGALGRDGAVNTMAEAYNADTPGEMRPARRGELCHDRLEAHARRQPLPVLPDEDWVRVWPWAVVVDAAAAVLGLELVDAEQVVYAPELGVAGRFDLKARLASRPDLGVVLLDLKTSEPDADGAIKKVYGDSFGLQLTAYGCATHQATFPPRVGKGRAGARFYYVNDDELAACVAPTPVDTFAILQVTPVGWRLVQIRCDDVSQAYLRSVVNAWRWLHLVSPTVVGDVLLEGGPS